MTIIEQILLGIALAMDCFSVSLASGLQMRRFGLRCVLLMAFFFGAFQAMMPLIGWVLTMSFGSYIESVDHWIAFGLLAFIGTKMIIDHFKGEEAQTFDFIRLATIITLAVATSIDALAVGVSFTCIGLDTFTRILSPIIIIGITSFLFSVAGNAIGVFLGRRFHFPAELLGGLILIGIGVKILIEHT